MRAESPDFSLAEAQIGSYLGRGLAYQYLGILCFSSFLFADFYFIALLGTEALAAASIAGPVILFILTFLLRMGNGVTVWVAKAVAGGWPSPIYIPVAILALLAFLFPLILGTNVHWLFQLLHVNEDLYLPARQYLVAMSMTLVLASVLVAILSYVRARGNHELVFKSLAILAIANLLIDPILIFGVGPIPHFGLVGAAMASGIAIILAVSFVLLKVPRHTRHTSYGQLKLNFKAIKGPLRYGLPLAFAGIFVPLRDAFSISLSQQMNQDALVALGIGQRLDFGIQLFYFALGAVLVPFISQNAELQHHLRVRTVVKYAMLIASLYILFVATVLRAFSTEIAELFAISESASAYLTTYLTWVPAAYLLLGFVFIGNGWLTALGMTKRVAIIGVAGIVTQVIAMRWLYEYFLFNGIVLSYFIMAAITLVLVVWFLKKSNYSVKS